MFHIYWDLFVPFLHLSKEWEEMKKALRMKAHFTTLDSVRELAFQTLSLLIFGHCVCIWSLLCWEGQNLFILDINLSSFCQLQKIVELIYCKKGIYRKRFLPRKSHSFFNELVKCMPIFMTPILLLESGISLKGLQSNFSNIIF